MLYTIGSQTVVRVPLILHEGIQGGARISTLLFFFTKNIFTAMFYLLIGFC